MLCPCVGGTQLFFIKTMYLFIHTCHNESRPGSRFAIGHLKTGREFVDSNERRRWVYTMSVAAAICNFLHDA